MMRIWAAKYVGKYLERNLKRLRQEYDTRAKEWERYHRVVFPHSRTIELHPLRDLIDEAHITQAKLKKYRGMAIPIGSRVLIDASTSKHYQREAVLEERRYNSALVKLKAAARSSAVVVSYDAIIQYDEATVRGWKRIREAFGCLARSYTPPSW